MYAQRPLNLDGIGRSTHNVSSKGQPLSPTFGSVEVTFALGFFGATFFILLS